MADQTFRAIITVLDRASAPLRAISDRLRTIGRETGLGEVGRAAGAATTQVRALAGQLRGIAGPLGALTAAGSVAGLSTMLASAVQSSRALQDVWEQLAAGSASQRQAIAGFRFSAEQAGLGAEAAGGALVSLRDTMTRARLGEDDKAAGLFRRLGITLRDRNGPRSALDILPQIAKAFERVTNAEGRAAMAAVFFGNSSPAMIRAIVELVENMRRYEEIGVVGVSQAEADSLDDLRRSWTSLKVAVGSVTDAIGAALAPVLKPLIEDLAKWVAANREVIATGIREFVSDLATTLKEFDWAGFKKGLSDAGRLLAGMVESLGGAKVAVAALAAVMAGPFVASLVLVAAALAKVALALVFNPVAAGIIVAAGAIAAAGLLIYKNWGKITAFFEKLWADLQAGFGPQVAWLRDTVATAFTGAARIIKDAWEGLVQIFEGVWKGITDPFVQAWETIKPIIDEMRSLMGGTGAPAGQGTLTQPDAQRLRRENFRDRGRIYGPIQPQSFSPGGAGGGQVQVHVRFDGAPAGTRAEATSNGPGLAAPVLEVGYAFGRRLSVA